MSAEPIALAQRMLANGYFPVPILRHDAPATIERGGKTVKQSPGKQPHGGLWARKETAVYGATAATIAGWRRLDLIEYPGLGTACGRVVAPDIDVYEPELARDVEALVVDHLGATRMRRVGQAPKAMLLYRAAAEPISKALTAVFFKGDLKAQLEVMGQGQQIVAFGRHPATGAAYTWSDGDPATVPAADLPEVTQEKIGALVVAAEALFRARGYRTKSEIEADRAALSPVAARLTQSAARIDGSNPFRLINDAALAAPDRWVPTVFGAGARCDARGVWRVPSSAIGRDLEEDISISPAGIVDFGEHDQGDPRIGKRTAIDLVIEHGGAANATAAAQWLAEQLGIEVQLGGRSPQKPDAEGKAVNGRRERIDLAASRVNENARRAATLLEDVIYMRGRAPSALVRAAEVRTGHEVVDDELEPGVLVAGVRHAKGSPLLVTPTIGLIQYQLDERADFFRLDRRANEWLPTGCPKDIPARMIDAATEMPFRPCAGIVSVPLFIKGRIVTEPGYHAESGSIIAFEGALPPIPARLTKADAIQALPVLLRPFRGYLQEGDPGLRAGFAAAALTAAMRASLHTAPVIVVDANCPAAGKGKAARALAVIATGTLPAIITEGHSEEETEKRLAAAILSGSQALLLDNLQRLVASSTLESGVTEGVATIRLFGQLSDMTVPFRALVLLTANNAQLRADMLRRSLPIRIVVDTDEPEKRAFAFDPYVEAKRDRMAILAAAFTIARAWWQARDTEEARQIRQTTLGSFELWADLVAGAVEWLTGINPISLIEARKAADPRRGQERQVIEALREAFGDAEFSAKKAVGRAVQRSRFGEEEEPATGLDPEIWASVMTFKGDRPTAVQAGNWLGRQKDKAFGELQLLGRLDRKGTALWRVRDLPGCRGVPGSIPSATREVSETDTNVESDSSEDAGVNRPGKPLHPGSPQVVAGIDFEDEHRRRFRGAS
ncbi:MAG: hypothetical protein WAS21_20495 [Geminicoccaceae bacterium]